MSNESAPTGIQPHELEMKIVSRGRRYSSSDPIRDSAALQRTINRLRARSIAPSGVYRFDSHEEADAWMMRMMANGHERQSSKTSSGSAGA